MTRIGILYFLLLISQSMLLRAQSSSSAALVDSLLATMSIEEKIGQTLMIRAHSNLGRDHINQVKEEIKKYKVGALCFFQGTPKKQTQLTEAYQELSEIPLLVAMDAEWGSGMRFKEAGFSYPRNLTLGAISEPSIIEEMGFEIGRELRSLGVHLNFAPVVDVNNNPENPVINNRSFGEHPPTVITHSLALMRGMDAAGVAACAKHFPGHGDTNVDSHKDLPIIRHNRQRLDSIELRPFRALIQAGVPSIMIAHLNIPALDDQANTPTTLSKKVVTGLLRNEMGYDGLIFTDAMEMKGVTKHFEAGEAEVRALIAGNDMICLPANVPKAVEAIKKAVETGRLTEEQLNERVRRILKLKADLNTLSQPIDTQLTVEERTARGPLPQVIKEELFSKSITCVSNKDNLIPVKRMDNGIMASLSIGSRDPTPFQEQLSFYGRVIDFQTDKYFEKRSGQKLLKDLEMMDVVFVGIHDMSKYAHKDFGLNALMLQFLRSLNEKTRVILVLFGSPYAISYFEEFDHLVVAYEDSPEAQRISAQMLFGAREISGRLPVSAGSLTMGSSFYIPNLMRLSVGLPESVGLDRDTLALIDSLAIELIDKKAAPGCQILVAKNNRIVYHKSFGYHTYDKRTPVLNSDVYDLASVTKVAATTLSVMKLVDQGKLDLSKPLGYYLPEAKGTNKEDLRIIDILSHRAGLKAWIAFYQETIEKDRRGIRFKSGVYSSNAEKSYLVPVAHRLFMNESYLDSIYQQILESEIRPAGKYVYSDLGMILMAKVIEAIDGRSVDQFALQEFYLPMGLNRTRFNPLNHRISSGSIPPTEKDNYFRMQTLKGYVHDMGAAMMGGVAGHAGLFSNSQELAAIFQMLLNKGVYGGTRYLSPPTIELFTTRVEGATRRGVGFDMKQLDEDLSLNMAEEASPSTFGHLGFTGTAAWADPDYDLIVIFLSNRTFPAMNNPVLSRENYRPKIQAIPYRALKLNEQRP